MLLVRIYFTNQSHQLLGNARGCRTAQTALLAGRLGFPLPGGDSQSSASSSVTAAAAVAGSSCHKPPYLPSRARLSMGRAAFRKWEYCQKEGLPYSWDGSILAAEPLLGSAGSGEAKGGGA